MGPMISDVLKKLKRAEKRYEAFRQEIESLESQKQAYLEEIMKGRRRSAEMKETDQSIGERRLALSKTREQVGNLRTQLETELTRFRKELVEEKQKELSQYMDRRTQYVKRIEELQVEASKYRYLVSGKKDHRLANIKNPLPSEAQQSEDFVPIDEIIGRTKLEVSRINRLDRDALLKAHREREKRNTRPS